ncbi:hypothetical protein CPB85DRAFT_1258350 [Mucidula mucida]|nr:hypothetical protein CPB85DRAFT_1258350 [Mucidula mucida]
MSAPAATEDWFHPEFSASDADVSVRSSDGVIFKLHRNNILAHTTVIPLPEGGDPGIADFSEPSKVLEIAFKFFALDYATLEAVGYIAHKYQLANLMASCDTCLQLKFMTSHPLNLLTYALAHWDKDMTNKVAKHTTVCRADQALEILGGDMCQRWWLGVVHGVSDHRGSSIHTICWRIKEAAVAYADIAVEGDVRGLDDNGVPTTTIVTRVEAVKKAGVVHDGSDEDNGNRVQAVTAVDRAQSVFKPSFSMTEENIPRRVREGICDVDEREIKRLALTPRLSDELLFAWLSRAKGDASFHSTWRGACIGSISPLPATWRRMHGR